MPSTYLSEIGTTNSNASGVATIQKVVPAGQYWMVSVVRVSTSSTPANSSVLSPNPTPYCALYVGAIGIQDGSTIVDDTILGSGDSSTIISSTIFLPGQALTAKWSNTIAGDTCYLVFYGRVYNNLVEAQRELPPVPGTKFAGNTGNGMVWEYVGNIQAGGVSVTGNPPVFTTPASSYIELITATVIITTDATVANRMIGLSATGTVTLANVIFFRVMSDTANQPASVVRQYTWSQGINNFSVANQYGMALPQRVVLPPLSTITLIASSTVAPGDLWANFSVTYRRYASLMKVSYT